MLDLCESRARQLDRNIVEFPTICHYFLLLWQKRQFITILTTINFMVWRSFILIYQ
jgi:hypothetical protein